MSPTDDGLQMFNTNKPGGYDPGEIVSVTEGEIFSMSCHVKATLPPSDVYWTYGDVTDKVSPNQKDPKLYDTTSTSTSAVQRLQHRQTFACWASIHVPYKGEVPSEPPMIYVHLEVIG